MLCPRRLLTKVNIYIHLTEDAKSAPDVPLAHIVDLKQLDSCEEDLSVEDRWDFYFKLLGQMKNILFNEFSVQVWIHQRQLLVGQLQHCGESPKNARGQGEKFPPLRFQSCLKEALTLQ